MCENIRNICKNTGKNAILYRTIFFEQYKENIARAIEYIALKQHNDNEAAR